MWYLEYAPDVFKRDGGYFPREDVLGRTGFRSVYALSEQDALTVRRTGASKHIDKFQVYSDELVMDFDNGYDDECKKAVKWARDHGCTFSVYESGKKGIHLEIATVPKYGRTVPASQRVFVEQQIQVACDVSLYRHGSLYRLPGTLHKSTGNPKKLIDSRLGDSLIDFPLLSVAAGLDFSSVPAETGIESALLRVLRWLNSPPTRGSRYMTLWQVSKTCKEGGLRRETAEDLLNGINQSWGKDAKESEEVSRAIREVYRESHPSH